MLRKHENQWTKKTLEEKKEIYNFSNGYKLFLNYSKTEREFIKEATKIAEENGFKSIENYETLKIGDKVYYTNRGKNIILAVIGKDKIESGANIIVSHADVPRLDLKGNPLYEDIELAMMKTHYYGGIKKYQWVSIPLALHGVVILEDGTKVDIIIGEDENDPVFTIPDILPHLARKVQGERKAGEVIKGEELNVLIGSIPSTIEDKDIKEKVKYAVLEKLNEKYGMVEEDFISAELQIVPAFKAKDVGLDRAIVGAYGHDDRICGFTSLKAIIDLDEVPNRTSICYIVDKEEIGSTGSTGLESNYIEFVLSDMINRIKGEYNEIDLKKCLWNSKAISADVSDALNPMFKEVHDSLNVAKLGQGIVVTKYTGSGGKYSTNDADAEFVFEIRKLFNERKISWQIGMLGKVDEGGGGTVAKYLAHFGIKTIDAGPALLAMHSPFELASKLDIYETYKAYKSF
ncbi:MAG: aminopeptidase, partial [Fusobacteriaceae bacterium]|nr:aminopeptidase [Fusobacteriaceae bacterium]